MLFIVVVVVGGGCVVVDKSRLAFSSVFVTISFEEVFSKTLFSPFLLLEVVSLRGSVIELDGTQYQNLFPKLKFVIWFLTSA